MSTPRVNTQALDELEERLARGESAKLDSGDLLYVLRGLRCALRAATQDRDDFEETLHAIADNAESFHKGEDGKAKALAVIAKWAQGEPIPGRTERLRLRPRLRLHPPERVNVTLTQEYVE